MVKDARAAGFREKWRQDVPVLYDWFFNHHLMWPSLSCRWGPVRAEHGAYSEQYVYISEQTDGTAPNTLLLANVAVAECDAVAPSLMLDIEEDDPSALVGVLKAVHHPGEVNRIRELPQFPQILATHTDGRDVFIWNMESQDDRRLPPGDGGAAADKPSVPDLVLRGHTDVAQFALATAASDPFVLSGGTDRHVVLWGLQDHVSKANTDDSSELAAPVLQCRETFTGHRATVEDVQFSPHDARLFCSVGDDYCLLLWDTRHGTTPVHKVERAHNADLHCVDWSGLADSYLLTGSADHSVRLFDRRKLPSTGHSAPVHTFKHHSDAVTCVQWHPSVRGVFGSAGDDGLIQVTDASHLMGTAGDRAGGGGPQGRQANMFQHLGHREKVCEFHWNPHQPWTVVSTSIDSGRIGGGTLQVWRMHDYLYLPEEEALKKIEEALSPPSSKKN